MGWLVLPEMHDAALRDVTVCVLLVLSAGMHNEGAGGKVQAARPSGGSHAESAEVSPSTQGKRTWHTVKFPLYSSVAAHTVTGRQACYSMLHFASIPEKQQEHVAAQRTARETM